MEDDIGSRESPRRKGNRTILTLRLTVEDAERLRQAFAEGKLKEFGILDLAPTPADQTEKEWRRTETRKGTGDRTPPL